MSLRAASLAALLLATACAGGGSDGGGEDHSTMRPGENCLASGCHAGSTTTTSFTAAGTVFTPAGAGVSGAKVTISDAGGAHAPIVMTTNSVGNFYTTAAISYPATVAVSGATASMNMTTRLVETRGCNECHAQGVAYPGPIHVP